MSVTALFKKINEIDLSKTIAEINKLKQALDAAAASSEALAVANRNAAISSQAAATAEDAVSKARKAQADLVKTNTQANRDAYAEAYKQMTDLEKKQFEMEDRLKELNRLYGNANATQTMLDAKRAEYEAAKESFLQAERDQQANPSAPSTPGTPINYSNSEISSLVKEALSQTNIVTDTAIATQLQQLSLIMESYKWNQPDFKFNIDFKQYGTEVDPSELIDAIQRAMRTAM